MICEPVTLTANGFQQAWLDAVRLLMDAHWERRNLVVQIRSPGLLAQDLHDRVTNFALSDGVAQTAQASNRTNSESFKRGKRDHKETGSALSIGQIDSKTT